MTIPSVTFTKDGKKYNTYTDWKLTSDCRRPKWQTKIQVIAKQLYFGI